MTTSGALTNAELQALAGHLAVLLSVHVDRAYTTDRGVELELPLGCRPADGALARFPGARQEERVYTDRALGQRRVNVVTLPWSGLRDADRTPSPTTWALAGAACVAVAVHVLTIV